MFYYDYDYDYSMIRSLCYSTRVLSFVCLWMCLRYYVIDVCAFVFFALIHMHSLSNFNENSSNFSVSLLLKFFGCRFCCYHFDGVSCMFGFSFSVDFYAILRSGLSFVLKCCCEKFLLHSLYLIMTHFCSFS